MNNLTKKISGIFLLISCFSPLSSQETTLKDFNKSVQSADVVFYYDNDFEKAASLYEPILKAFPENANIQAKLGICFLKLDGKQPEALKLLESASKNVAANKKEYTETGQKAPVDTYRYLAEAYQLNNNLEKALSIFTDLKSKLGTSEEDVEMADYYDLQIRDCRYALEAKKKPVRVLSELFASWLNDYPGAMNPVVSKNDSVFIFTQRVQGINRIMCSYKNGKWEEPVDITQQLGGLDRLYTNSVSGNGRFLVLYINDGDDGNLYFSERNGATWSKIKNFGKPVNTIYWESHGFITPDATKLYLSSNRPGTFGKLDIWVSEKTPAGTWSEPVNLGEVINTTWDEDAPFFDTDNNALLFSSVGHMSMGKYDIFRSTTDRYGNWNQPVGMPFAFNTTAENIFFHLNNNAPGFITSLYDEKTGTRNIYAIVGVDPADEITRTEGVLKLADGMNVIPSQAQMILKELKKGNILQTIPVNDDGSFKFDLKPGDYHLIVSHTGYRTDTTNLSLPLYFLSQYMKVNPTLIPEKAVTGEFLLIRNILFAFDSHALTGEAKENLETLKTILNNYPELKVEVAGYTDALGSLIYNRKLADKRAQTVIDYVTASGIPANRFVKKAFGESNFAAINTNRNGTDNPEGRKYNRRATFGVIEPGTGVVIRLDTDTPKELVNPSTTRYSIILKKSPQKLSSGYFSNLDLSGKLNIRTIEDGTATTYTIGVFFDKADAEKYLNYVKGKGFADAYVTETK
jgi:outer membrane protein OmpA-like peptidoglycan-associated protein/tetratricopeptide (TPR) repeat protein